MITLMFRAGSVCALVLSAPLAAAQEPSIVAASPAVADCAGCVTIPALTPVRLEVMKAQGSKISKTGDMFPIRLADALTVDGHEIVAAGTTGMGEVVHAKKGGGSGAAGELVLAARFLDVGGRHLRLRSMHVSLAGRSNIGTVNAINIASAASAVPIGFIGYFITGGQATVPAGTIADAKTAEAFTLAAPAPPVVVHSVPAQGEINAIP